MFFGINQINIRDFYTRRKLVPGNMLCSNMSDMEFFRAGIVLKLIGHIYYMGNNA